MLSDTEFKERFLKMLSLDYEFREKIRDMLNSEEEDPNQ